MNNEILNESQREIIRALEDGRRTIATLSRVGKSDPVRVGQMQGLASALVDPAKFWAQAAAGEVQADAATVELTAATIRASAAKLALGDYQAVREALIGQAAWLSAMAVRLSVTTVEGCGKHAATVDYLKLSLRAAECAAKNLASAAALEALNSGKAVIE